MTTPFTAPAKPAVPASQRSVDYLRDLMLDKAAHLGQDEAAAAAKIDAWLADNNDQKTISSNIDRLKQEGYTGRKHRGETKADATDTLPGPDVVPDGYYALPTEEGAKNAIAFYRVDRPTEGRWAGYVFAHRYMSDTEMPLGRDGSHRLVHRIAEFGAAEASALYGRETARCGVCHRKLTNDESRARGIGPDCAAKLGW